MNNELITNLLYVDLLNDWNPFQLKDADYETEIADVIYAIYETDEPLGLAKKIQSIYEFSFTKKIPIEECVTIAKKLLIIKDHSSCSL